MNKSTTPLLLIIIAIGIYFTYTRVKIEEIKQVRKVNASYQKTMDDYGSVIKIRDEALAKYNKIDIADRESLEKILPDNIDNVRLIIDTNSVAAKNGLILKNIKTNSPESNKDGIVAVETNAVPNTYSTATLSFSVASNYETFVKFMKDLEKNLRIMDISKLTLATGEDEIFTFSVEIKTYWIKHK